MNTKCRFGLLIVLLFVALLVCGQTVLAQAEAVVSPEILAAMKSFDQKYFLPDYIAYSGIGPVARQALAFQYLEDYDLKSLRADSAVSQTPRLDYVFHGGIDWVAPDSLATAELEDYDDKDLPSVGLASQVPVTDTVDGLVAQLAQEEINKAQNYGWVAPGALVSSDMETVENKSIIAQIYANWIAEQALAVPNLEDYDLKSLSADSAVSDTPRPAYVAHGDIDWVAPGSLAMSELEDYDDKGLPSVGLASQVPVTGAIDGLVAQRALEEFYKAQNYGLNSQEEMDFAHVDCWDRKFYLPGHVVCPDGPVVSEPALPGI
jgi:hypothetical protein